LRENQTRKYYDTGFTLSHRDIIGAGGDERMLYADEAEADKLVMLTEETRVDRMTIRLINGRPVSMLKAGKPPAHHIL